jgi:hypothetical protein
MVLVLEDEGSVLANAAREVRIAARGENEIAFEGALGVDLAGAVDPGSKR